MIRGIEDLSHTSVKEVMVPRIDVDFISSDIQESELISKIKESGHSRFPVYSESIDNVIGVLYVKDLIFASDSKKPVELEKIIRKPLRELNFESLGSKGVMSNKDKINNKLKIKANKN